MFFAVAKFEKCVSIVSQFQILCVAENKGTFMALTDTKLKSLHGKRRSARAEFPDREGLVAVAGLSGKVSWVFRYRFGDKSKRITLGSYPAFTLLEARDKATAQRKILEGGVDPAALLVADSSVITLPFCAEQWLTKYVSTLAPKTQGLYVSNANKYFTLAKFKLDVRTARVEDWVTYFDAVAAESSRVNAVHILKTIKSLVRWCKSRNIIDRCAVLDLDVRAVGVRSEVGQRHLSLIEVARLWVVITRSKATPAIKAAVKLLLIFGARNSEIREARFNEFDLTNLLWTLPKERTKTNKTLQRPIPRLAADLIRELQMIYKSEYLIPGAHRGTCMTVHSLNRFTTRMWAHLHVEFGTERFTPHDFRRTLSNRLSEQKVLPHVTERMLGHELQGVMAIYNKHDWLDEQRTAYTLWCDLIEGAIKKELAG